MVIGILKDRKIGERRIILTPREVRAIVLSGHRALIEAGAGEGCGFEDEKYVAVGAEIVKEKKEIFERSDLIAKVKELLAEEYKLIKEGQIILSCLHPAANNEETEALIRSKCISFTVEDMHRYGSANSEAAGKIGALLGIHYLLSTNGGKGKYVGGLCGAPPINALVIGGGLVGKSALSVLYALGGRVTVMDVNLGVLRRISEGYSGVATAICNKEAIKELLPETDLVLNCVKWQKERRDHLIDRPMLKTMEKGSVIVDISADFPGAIESGKPTTQEEPTYTDSGVIHICVDNIPSAVARSVSIALGAEMLPYILSIMNEGVKGACLKDGYLRRAMVTYKGYLTHEETSAVQKRPWITPEEVLGITGENMDKAPSATVTKSCLFMKNIVTDGK